VAALDKLSESRRDAIESLIAKYDEFCSLLEVPSPDLRKLDELDDLADAVLPTRWKEKQPNVFARRIADDTFHQLWRPADEFKIRLVDDGKHTVPASALVQIAAIQELQLGQNEAIDLRLEQDLYSRIRPKIQRAVRACRQVIMGPQGQKYNVDSIQLAGNSCKIPLVKETMVSEFKEFLNIEKMVQFNPENAKSSVALGACIAAYINDWGKQLPVRMTFNPIPERLGWEIGIFDKQFTPFRAYFTADARPSQRPTCLIADTEQPRISLFRRRPGQKVDPTFMGAFVLTSPGVKVPGLPPMEQGKLQLILTGVNTLKLRRQDLVWDMQYPEVTKEDIDDPFSGHH
jgi:hypothetical protein